MPTWFYPIISALISIASGWGMWHLTQKRADKKAGAGDEKTWRESRLAAEADVRSQLAELKAAFAERKKAADAERLQTTLKFESDLANIAATLDKLADVADKQTTMIERVGWQGKEIERIDRASQQLHQDIERIRTDINNLYRAKP